MDPLTTLVKGFGEAGAYKANARSALQEAQVALDQAAREEGQARREKSQLEGAQIAAAGASGTTLEGSNMSVILDNAVQSELNALNARYAGQLKSTAKRNEAYVSKWQARGALAGAILKAGSDAVKGVAGAGKYGPT